MKIRILRRIRNLTITLTLICLPFLSFSQQNNIDDSYIKSNVNSDESGENLNNKEKWGDHDNLHYLSNYLENKIDTIFLKYRYDLCLCPKWCIFRLN